MVSNLRVDEIRDYAKLVDEERSVSSLPLIQHICAMCGYLLQPRLREGCQEVDMGKCGKHTKLVESNVLGTNYLLSCYSSRIKRLRKFYIRYFSSQKMAG